ncbi:MAG: hypothetical protein DRO00_04965 [Thermoproteota archaeon]|nr:MAG: hypothetical protein DRO00_04965 [Candidatus Korarchaeota archaeon]
MPLVGEEFLIKAGMPDQDPKEFFARLFAVCGVMLTLAAILYRTGYLTDPVRLAFIAIFPSLFMALTPFLSYLNLSSKLEKDLWAYLATLWMLQKVGKSLGSSFNAISRITEDNEVKKYFQTASARMLAAGTIEGLDANIRLCPSSVWRRIYSRLHDYYFTRGEAIDEMLKIELDESVEKTMIDVRNSMERLVMILIIYTLSSTAFPFVVMLMFTFQSLVSGFGGGGMSNLVLMTSVLPSPFFVLLFKILAPRYFYFEKKTVIKAWLSFLATFVMVFIILSFLLQKLPPSAQIKLLKLPIPILSLNIWQRLALSTAIGSFVGFMLTFKEERKLKSETFDFPLFLQDLFSELRGGRSFSDAIYSMKITYKSLKDFANKVKAWAALRLPYTEILKRMAERQKLSVSKMSTLLIMTALEAGADLKEAFSSISEFAVRLRELWIETEGEKIGNYFTAMFSFMLVIGSYALLVNILNIPMLAPHEAETIKEGIMMQALVQTLVMGGTLGLVRTGHFTSSFRELFIFSVLAFFIMLTI